MAPNKPKSVYSPPPLLFDGKSVQVNDSVFISAPWGSREGEPYMIGRIMEFLPSTSIPASNNPQDYSEGSTTGPRARVAYYLRPRDISNRYISDFRLIVATMNADIVPISYIRGICTVKHRDEIKNLDDYKREKDSFYFHSLYDRYLHRYFDAVPTNQIQNAPANVVSHLVNNFEYILCEPSISNELCDAQRGCLTCSKWAASTESVTCALCKCLFHLSCLDPPLLQRPKTGYSWSCAPCSKAREEEVEAYMETGVVPVMKISDTVTVPGANNSRAKGKGRASDSSNRGNSSKGKGKEVEVVSGPEVAFRTTNGWPMRYFGMHTDALAVLDPHDSLYPRASTRLGNKFQVIVPVWDTDKKEQESKEQSNKVTSNPKRSRNGTPVPKVEKDSEEHVTKKKKSQLPDRGEDEAAQIIYQPSEKISDTALDKLLKSIKSLPVYAVAGVDLIDKTLSLIKDGNISEALIAAGKIPQTSLGCAVWTTEEKKKLVEGAAHHNNDIEEISDEIEGKTLADIVKRYYMVIGHTLQEDVPAQNIEERVVVISRSGRRASGVNYAEDWFENDESSEDEGSVVGPALTATEKRNRICAVCSAKSSLTWYHCPESFGETAKAGKDHLMCNACGIRWRHYGASYPPTIVEEVVKPTKVQKKVEKPEPEIKKEVSKVVVAPKEVAVKELSKDYGKDIPIIEPARMVIAKITTKPLLPAKPCVLCKKLDPKPQLSQCYNCGLSVHDCCYGIPEDSPANWLCHLCNLSVNSKRIPSNLGCVLCPESADLPDSEPVSALECIKPSEGNHYVHLLCGIFHPETKFSNPDTLSVIEGVCSIPIKRRNQKCHICSRTDVGACVKCEDCNRHFHVSCAWTANYKFGFEIQPLKKKRTREVVPARFKEEDGSMIPCVWCPDHQFSQVDRKTYDIAHRDPRTRLTALQTYARSDKAARPIESFPLIRQARRFENQVLPVLPPPVQAPNSILDNISEKSVDTLASLSPPPPAPPPRSIQTGTSIPRVPIAQVVPEVKPSRPSAPSRKNPNPKGSTRPKSQVKVPDLDPSVVSASSRNSTSSTSVPPTIPAIASLSSPSPSKTTYTPYQSHYSPHTLPRPSHCDGTHYLNGDPNQSWRLPDPRTVNLTQSPSNRSVIPAQNHSSRPVPSTQNQSSGPSSNQSQSNRPSSNSNNTSRLPPPSNQTQSVRQGTIQNNSIRQGSFQNESNRSSQPKRSTTRPKLFSSNESHQSVPQGSLPRSSSLSSLLNPSQNRDERNQSMNGRSEGSNNNNGQRSFSSSTNSYSNHNNNVNNSSNNNNYNNNNNNNNNNINNYNNNTNYNNNSRNGSNGSNYNNHNNNRNNNNGNANNGNNNNGNTNYSNHNNNNYNNNTNNNNNNNNNSNNNRSSNNGNSNTLPRYKSPPPISYQSTSIPGNRNDSYSSNSNSNGNVTLPFIENGNSRSNSYSKYNPSVNPYTLPGGLDSAMGDGNGNSNNNNQSFNNSSSGKRKSLAGNNNLFDNTLHESSSKRSKIMPSPFGPLPSSNQSQQSQHQQHQQHSPPSNVATTQNGTSDSSRSFALDPSLEFAGPTTK